MKDIDLIDKYLKEINYQNHITWWDKFKILLPRINSFVAIKTSFISLLHKLKYSKRTTFIKSYIIPEEKILHILKKKYDSTKSKRKRVDILKHIISIYLKNRDFINARKYIEYILKIDNNPNNIYQSILDYISSLSLKIRNRYKSTHKNICLIQLDTVRYDHCSFNGYKRETTPFLNSLKEHSIIFRNAFSTAHWTLPSVASIFSGLMPSQHGAVQVNSILTEENNHLMRFLKDSGYYTIGVVKIPLLTEEYGFANLFDHFTSSFSFVEHSTATLFWKALNSAKKKFNQPFFFFLNLIEPHRPYLCLNHQWGDPLNDPGSVVIRNLNDKKISQKEKKNLINCYDDGIHYIDQQLEFYINLFPEDTLFIILSDHGEILGEYNWVEHGNKMFKSVFHIPLLLYHPSFKFKFIDHYFSLKDIFKIIKSYIEDKDFQIETVVEKKDYVVFESGYRISADSILGYKKIRKYKDDLERYIFGIMDDKYKLLKAIGGKDEFYELPHENKNIINEAPKELLKKYYKLLNQEYNGNFQIKVSYKEILNENEQIKERLKDLGYL